MLGDYLTGLHTCLHAVLLAAGILTPPTALLLLLAALLHPTVKTIRTRATSARLHTQARRSGRAK